MLAVVAGIIIRTVEIKFVAVAITRIDAVTEMVVAPISRTIKIGQTSEALIFRTAEDVRQVEIAAVPIRAIEVVIIAEIKKIIIVHLISSLILLIGQIQLISHLVG